MRKGTCYRVVLLLCLLCTSVAYSQQKKPNIIIIYADDLGYGDLSCYGATGVKTRNIDKLATKGIKFTDAHCTAATCTPSRYSLITGSYAFRNNAAILAGDAPLLIDTNMGTLPKMLQKAGYKTGVVGKWHLGLGKGKINWNENIAPGPAEIGFNYSFLIPATGDRVPVVYVENQKVVNLKPDEPLEVNYRKKIGNAPTGIENPGLLKMKADTQHSNTIINGVSRIGFQSGGNSAKWVDEEFPFILTQKATDFIEQNKEQPFFLYFSFHDIHVPRLPNKKFLGKSSMGPRGDAIAQMDWCTGQIVKLLKKLNIDKNTLILFSSDNGPVLNDGYEDKAVEMLDSHKPAGPYRGGKYSIFEGGTRMPTISYWPSVIKPAVSNALWSQVDLYASLAKLTGQHLKENDAPDSQDMLKVIMGQSIQGRDIMVEEAFAYAIRKDVWKYIEPSSRGASFLKNKHVETGVSKTDQLYNLKNDPGEKNNITKKYPEKVNELKALLKEERSRIDDN